MRKPNMRNYTAGSATFATAAELSRRGYDVALTFGNTPKVDLLCSSKSGKQCKVQVKGITSTGVFIQKHFFDDATQDDLFFVIVEVPLVGQPLRFFIMTHEQIKDADRDWREKHPQGKTKPGCEGLYYNYIKPYENKWESIVLWMNPKKEM